MEKIKGRRLQNLGKSIGSGRQFQLTVGGATDQMYVLQASTYLSSTSWVKIYTGVPPFIVTDPDASN